MQRYYKEKGNKFETCSLYIFPTKNVVLGVTISALEMIIIHLL